jgi:hypothetical protein
MSSVRRISAQQRSRDGDLEEWAVSGRRASKQRIFHCCIDDFQANRAPDLRYRTTPIGALFMHTNGGFYHDGRFPTLTAVVDHYNTCMSLGLTTTQRNDLIQYLLSLTF